MSPDVPRPSQSWRLPTRIAFRFVVAYFVPYFLLTQVLGSLIALSNIDIPTFGFLSRSVTWVAAHVFHAKTPLVIDGSGSGDKTFDWVFVFCLLIVASIATALWSVLDRKRQNYVRLQQWFRVLARFALGATMFSYGFAKVIPLQMSSPPPLSTLVEPFGQLSPMGVLWASIGASKSYEMFAGSAEVLAGVLICLPGLATLGAIVCLLDSIQIFTLNMTYDVPVKLFSFHLIVLSLVVLAPELSRLINAVVLNRAAGASTQVPLGRTPGRRRIAVVAQIAFTAYLLGMNFYGVQQSRRQYGDLAPASPLKGIWSIETMTMDGVPRPPEGSGADRWRRVIIATPTFLVVQKMNDSFQYFRAQIDAEGHTILLTSGPGQQSQPFTFTQPSPQALVLDGTLNSTRLHIETTLLDYTKFPLLTRGFHWIQEYPYNR